MIENTNNQKRWIWVPCVKELYKPAYIMEETSTMTTAQSEVVEEFRNEEVFKMNPSKFDRSEDLASLSHLNEPSVLHNIKQRYDEAEIYSYSGLFLLALNPYRQLNIYTEDMKNRVRKDNGREAPPHIYTVANEAYRSMMQNRANQSILVTGESGAGKTENTKKVIEYLSFLSDYTNADTNTNTNMNTKQSLSSLLVNANPILEAFGNAKTIKNDNSSRFGKFIQIKFKEGKIKGAKIEKYLLEKSRVIFQNKNERNFHAFYYLLAGAEDTLLEQLHLERDVSKYRCLSNIEYFEGAREGYDRLVESFRLMGVTDTIQYFKVLSAILHLSTIRCDSTDTNNTIQICAQLLNINHTKLAEAILNPEIKAGNEIVKQERSTEQRTAVIEGLMKALYENLFDNLINTINSKLDSSCDNYIAILDIAGFEIFDLNSFEQLCINYTNEKLQQYFNHHMFILEQELYKTEGIDWNFIDFGLDLEPTIQIIESHNPIGILSYIDEECVMPCASDSTLREKIAQISGIEPVQFKNSFRIKHYAGFVEYEVDAWLSKNKDVDSVSSLFGTILFESDLIKGTNKGTGVFKKDSNLKKGVFKTVGQSHKESLKNLMAVLRTTEPHFVRCILPNLNKDADSFDKKLVLGQLRCNGVLEGIRISRLGYPSRLPFTEFNLRYSMLSDTNDIKCTPRSVHINIDHKGGVHDINMDDHKNKIYNTDYNICDTVVLPRNITQSIINSLNINSNDYRIGNSLVFFRQGILAELETLRDKRILKLSISIQNIFRKLIAIKKHNLDAHRHSCINIIQTNSRLSLLFLRWKWWALFLKISPLLEVKKSENDMKIKDESIQSYISLIEKEKLLSASKDKSIEDLSISIQNIECENKNLLNSCAEKDDLISALRNSNFTIQESKNILENNLNSEIQYLNKSIIDHNNINESNKGKIEFMENLLKTKESEISDLIKEVNSKNREIDLIVKQDLGNILKEKEEELKRVLTDYRNVININQQDKLDKDSTISKLSIEIQKLNSELQTIHSQLEESTNQIQELNSQIIESEHSNRLRITKMRDELNDLQLENDNLLSKYNKYEPSISSLQDNFNTIVSEKCDLIKKNSSLQSEIANLNNTIKGLKNDLEYQKSRVDSLSRNTSSENTIAVLESTISSLKTKLASEQKINSKLSEDKSVLFDENVKLSQSKLDDLFSCEAEFNTRKSALQIEIRKLEIENAKLKHELSELSSDSSDDHGFERVSALLDLENHKKVLDLKTIEFENRIVILENELNSQIQENENLINLLKRNESAEMKQNLSAFKSEIAYLKNSINSISATFQREYFTILNEKDVFYMNLLCEKESALSENIKRVYDEQGVSIAKLEKINNMHLNELEAMKVAQNISQVTIKELKTHILSLENNYNSREQVINKLKEDCASNLNIMNERAREYSSCIEVLQNIKETEYESMLKAKNDSLLKENSDLQAALFKSELAYKKMIELRNIAVSNENIQSVEFPAIEKIVSAFVVDKEALKAFEWKNVVAAKCNRCSISKDVNDNQSSVALKNEINLLNLKVKQTERIIDENKKIVEAMKSCISVVRVNKKSK